MGRVLGPRDARKKEFALELAAFQERVAIWDHCGVDGGVGDDDAANYVATHGGHYGGRDDLSHSTMSDNQDKLVRTCVESIPAVESGRGGGARGVVRPVRGAAGEEDEGGGAAVVRRRVGRGGGGNELDGQQQQQQQHTATRRREKERKRKRKRKEGAAPRAIREEEIERWKGVPPKSPPKSRPPLRANREAERAVEQAAERARPCRRRRSSSSSSACEPIPTPSSSCKPASSSSALVDAWQTLVFFLIQACLLHPVPSLYKSAVVGTLVVLQAYFAFHHIVLQAVYKLQLQAHHCVNFVCADAHKRSHLFQASCGSFRL
ncbi:hypothetical protein DFJ73DRAFT_803256 [Zopfochytrium polystomum]|nr:hypothetical protein DFJ73DRAFT_803256 [Zopfochytrium polystomum]